MVAWYVPQANGSVFVRNSQVQRDGTIYEEEGLAVLAFPNASPVLGVLNVTFPGQPPFHPNYYVLDTDYDNYALVWNCWQISINVKSESVWLFQRDERRQPTRPANVQRLLDLHFSEFSIRPTYQSPTCINRASINRTMTVDDTKAFKRPLSVKLF